MRSCHVLPAGSWDPLTATDKVLLDYDHRHRRRICLRTEAGRDLLLDLPQAVRLRDRDGLVTDTGDVVCVVARAETCADIRARQPARLVGIAWHLGNRHLPVQVLPDRIRIRADHVIEAMVARLGGQVAHIDAPFDPEAGAYAPSSHTRGQNDNDDHQH